MISMDLAETERFEPSIADGRRASFDPRWADFTFGDAVLDKNLPRFPGGRLQPQHREKVVSAASDVSSSPADFNRTVKRSSRRNKNLSGGMFSSQGQLTCAGGIARRRKQEAQTIKLVRFVTLGTFPTVLIAVPSFTPAFAIEEVLEAEGVGGEGGYRSSVIWPAA
jgi:hypothetical protein